MSYRQSITRPTVMPRTDVDWLQWLDGEQALMPTAPRAAGSCRYCRGAVLPDSEGRPYGQCLQCLKYQGVFNRLVPITYSTDSGLESMLQLYKDTPGYRWLAGPLGALLNRFAAGHLQCLQNRYQLDVIAAVPSDNEARTFNPLQLMVQTYPTGVFMTSAPVDFTLLSRDRSRKRPDRTKLVPDAYVVNADVTGMRVLLLDDTWTSGSTMASCAAALTAHGALTVVGLTLGRQINATTGYGTTGTILSDAGQRGWREDECVVCKP